MEDAIEEAKSMPMKKTTKGKSKPSKISKKKQEAVEKAKKPFMEQQMKEFSKKRKLTEKTQLPKSLERFVRKKAVA